MKIKAKNFKLESGHKHPTIKLATKIKSIFSNEDDAKEALKKTQKELSDFQEKLYANQKWSVLIILQGMDTSGKDGLIEHVLSGINPQGCEVKSFKKPTHLELAHDYLWRTHLSMPVRGKIGVFNRSYYEDVVVPQVHPEILKDSGLPESLVKDKKLIHRRCKDIVHFEEYLERQGVLIIKIFLHLSKSEQKSRLMSRLDTPEKNWKFEDSDLFERGFWSKYQKAYDVCLTETTHNSAPWYVIPADDKEMARFIASQIILEKVESLGIDLPQVSPERKKVLSQLKKKLQKT